MSDLGNYLDVIGDWKNARDSWLASMGKAYKRVRLHLFQGYETTGNQANPNETFRRPKYVPKLEHIWLSQVKVYDTVKMGYFTTGDLDVYSEFIIRGYSPEYLLESGTAVDEYSGDLVEWNGKFWEVSDQLEPVTYGPHTPHVWYRTVLRRTNRSGAGTESGP